MAKKVVLSCIGTGKYFLVVTVSVSEFSFCIFILNTFIRQKLFNTDHNYQLNTRVLI